MRTRYRYQGRSGNRMYWEARIPGDSRVDEVSCGWDWFWSPARRAEVGLTENTEKEQDR